MRCQHPARCLALLCALALAARAQVQVQVDNDDPAIEYTPLEDWYIADEANDHSLGGFHRVTTVSTATATFRFTGTGIQYMAPLFSDMIDTQVSLDGGPPELISLQDTTVVAVVDSGATVESSPLWSQQGLENVEHELVISVAPGSRLALVDAFVITQEDDTTESTSSTEEPTATEEETSTRTTSTRTRPSPTDDESAASPEASPTPATRLGLTVGISVVGGLAGVVLIGGLLFWLRRRRRAARERQAWGSYAPARSHPPPPPPAAMAEVDDSINSGKARFRSVPSRNTLKAYIDEADRDSGVFSSAGGVPVGGTMSPNASFGSAAGAAAAHAAGKNGSKLRQVVATDDSAAPPAVPAWQAGGQAHSRT